MSATFVGGPAPLDGERSLYFGVVVWGEVFRHYFVEYLVGSLLATGNFPEDIGRRKVMLVCCPSDDWRHISAALEAKGCIDFISVEWIEFSPDRSRPIASMSLAHSKCFRRAFDDRAYLSMLSPDAIYSTGFVRYLDQAIRNGRQLVLCPAFRVEELAFFAALGLAAPSRLTKLERPSVSYSAERLTGASVSSLHSEILTSDIDAKCFNTFPNNFHIRAPDDSWFVSKNLSWAPVLIDLTKCDEKLLDGVAESVIDSQILAQMMDPNEGEQSIDFVFGSSSIALSSWAPELWSARSLKPRLYQRSPWIKRFYNDLVARMTLRRYLLDEEGTLTDWIKVRGLGACVIYATPEVNPAAIEIAANRLEKYLARTGADFLKGDPRSFFQMLLDHLWIVLWSIDVQTRYGALAYSYCAVLFDAYLNRGNARDRVRRRISQLLGI